MKLWGQERLGRGGEKRKRRENALSGNGDNGVGDLVSEVGLGGLLHLTEDHGGNLLSGEGLGLVANLNLDDGLSHVTGLDLERVVLHVALDLLVVETTTDETLRVEDGVGRVGGSLVLRGITDETLAGTSRESDVRGGDTVSLVVGEDLDAAVTLNTISGKEKKRSARCSGTRN